MAHCEGTLSFLEYAFAATTTRLKSRSVGENIILIPHSFKEAMTLSEAEKRKAAADKKMAGLKNLGVYALVPASPGRKLIGTKWEFKRKADATFKARLVVQGWVLVPGVDCGGTFAPVCRLQSIRMVIGNSHSGRDELRCFPTRRADGVPECRRRGGRVR